MSSQDDDAEIAMGSSPGSGDVFDVRKVRKLVELMDEHDLAEIVLQQGDQKMKLRRGGEPMTLAAAPAMPVAPTPAPAAPTPPPTATAADAGEATAGDTIVSPMVGTFYTAASPDAAPFVKVGDQVGPDTTVCIIEAMKVFNEIPAECSGKIVAVLVENGAPVEFGQPLFKVQKN